jgi:aquaporin Z
MNKYLAEFGGTFFWMLTIGCVSIGAGAGTIPAIGIGAIVAVMTVLLANISGAHFNPAVSVALWRTGDLPAKELAPYIVFQFLGAGAAAAAVKVIKSGMGAGTIQVRVLPVFLAEVLFTALLCFGLLHLLKQTGKVSVQSRGALLGGIVMTGVFAMGAVSGAAFNPAITVGSCVLGLLPFKSLWLYLLAQMLGGLAAAYACRGLHPVKQ